MVTMSPPTCASLTITVTDIPLLPTEPAARVAAIQALAEDFGRATVEAGFNRAEDMPPSDNYAAAAAAVANMLSEGSITLAFLVNLVAALDAHKDGEAHPSPQGAVQVEQSLDLRDAPRAMAAAIEGRRDMARILRPTDEAQP